MNFSWCDLSTFDIAKALAFYGSVFGWEFGSDSSNSRSADYTTCYSQGSSIAGVYTMPAFFQSIEMPSFWMSYLNVECIDRVYEQAGVLGAKCEIGPTSFDEHSRFALIRDPSGAGFTLYEGPIISEKNISSNFASVRYELHVDSLKIVREFYEQLCGWKFVADPGMSARHSVHSPNGTPLASIVELDPVSKGPKNYWSVVFAVKEVQNVINAALKGGGQIIMEANRILPYTMLEDDQGAMFCVSEENAG